MSQQVEAVAHEGKKNKQVFSLSPAAAGSGFSPALLHRRNIHQRPREEPAQEGHNRNMHRKLEHSVTHQARAFNRSIPNNGSIQK
jgi:hypothetical protein